MTIRIRGFSWCKDEEKEIPISRARSKILCKHHNEQLSPIDSAGASAFGTLKASREVYNIRQQMRPRLRTVKEYKINGLLLERWFLKTLINLVCVGDGDIGWADGAPRATPPSVLVDCCYGFARLVQPMGLYVITSVGMEISDRDYLRFSPLLEYGRIVAGIFEFRGFHFLLSVREEPLPKDLLQANGPMGSQPTDLVYHPRAFQMDNAGRHSQVVKLTWK